MNKPTIVSIIKNITLYGLLILLFACTETPEQQTKERLLIAKKADAISLNPVAAGDAFSIYLSTHLFQTLLGIDYKTEKLVGVLAKDRPEIAFDEDGNQLISYKIRPNAKFDNGTSITATDVLFSLKVNVCPLVDNLGGRFYYGNRIDSVITYPSDSLKITFLCKNVDLKNELVSGDFAILPQSNYDSNKLLENVSYFRLLNDTSLKHNDTITQFANNFNQQRYAFQKDKIQGSGAYKLTEWQKGQRIILTKKENWWANGENKENTFFNCNASRIQYEIIPDKNTAIAALKAGEIDFIKSIESKAFEDLKTSNKANQLTFKTTNQFAYRYLGFNLNKQILKDLSVRKAIAHSLPLELILKTVLNNEAAITHVPLAAAQTKLINKNIEGYPYDLKMAKQLLKVKWSLGEEKMLFQDLNDKKEYLKLTYGYNSGNQERKAIGLILKQELKKIGVELEVKGVEWAVYSEKLRNGEFDLFFGGTVTLPTTPDFFSEFHSKSANGGRNYANYQNPEIDSLIEQIRIELDESRQQVLIDKFQEIIHQDLPYLYLYSPKERVAFSNQLKNVNIYSLRPNFWAPEIGW